MTELPDVPDNIDQPVRLEDGQTITRELLETIREVNRDYVAALDEGAEPWPPVDGVRYVAAASSRTTCRARRGGHAAAGGRSLSPRRRGRPGRRPAGARHDGGRGRADAAALRPFQGDRHQGGRQSRRRPARAGRAWVSELAAQAAAASCRCGAGRGGTVITFERILEINDIVHRKWCACWEGGVQVRKLPFDGVLVERLVNEAIAISTTATSTGRPLLRAAEGAMLRWRR